MTSLLASKRHGALAFSLALFGILTCNPDAVLSVGIAYVPGAEPEDIHGGQPSISLLTWALPNGVLVADRTSPGDEVRFGQAFKPAFAASEWFVIQPKCGLEHGSDPKETLERLGEIHLQDGSDCLLEVPLDRLGEFDALQLSRHRVLLSPPPPGWEAFEQSKRRLSAPTKVDGTLKAEFLAQLSDQAFFQTIREISGDMAFFHDGSPQSVSTRYYNTSDNNIVAGYLGNQLAGYGYTIEFEEFLHNGVACQNVIATKLGLDLPDEYVVVGGHYDSTSPQPQTSAPGAEDNGSGSSMVMELARICADRNFERSIQFVLFDAEEVGLVGSSHFVDEAIGSGRDIVAAVIADMITWYDDDYAVIIEGQAAWEWLMSTMEDNVAGFTSLSSRKDYFSWGSDHVPFQQADIPAFLAIDWDWGSYPGYHQTSDTWSTIAATAEIGVEIARACAGTLADVAVLKPIGTAVGDELPELQVALQAFPNPFNPRVTILYRLQTGAPGELAVYDLAGRRLVVLARGNLPEGRHEVTWDGRDEAGRPLASGTYLCRLKTAEATARLKLNLTR